MNSSISRKYKNGLLESINSQRKLYFNLKIKFQKDIQHQNNDLGHSCRALRHCFEMLIVNNHFKTADRGDHGRYKQHNIGGRSLYDMEFHDQTN